VTTPSHAIYYILNEVFVAQPPHVVTDHIDEVLKSIRQLSRARVYVGIPATSAGRSDPKSPSNALLGYVHEHGSPERNIPARPFLIPGVKSVEDRTQAGLQRAAEYALDGKIEQMLHQLGAVGMTAASAVKKKISEGLAPPLAERTVRARLRKTQAGRRRLRKLEQGGVNLYQWGATNLKPLIDTGQLRNAITYVIRG
jgi:hypothetical protein